MNPKSIHILAVAALLPCALHAEVKPHPLFSDGAVLQRGIAVPVWGTARDGEKVTVEFHGQTATTTATGGKWSVKLEPLKEGGPFTMKITGENTVTVDNLLVGEVWVCSGQSNMQWPFSKTHNAKEEAPKANYPEIRMFTVTRTVSAKPLDEPTGSWITCSPETVNNFSGVGYFFARDIHRQLGVPVGMIHTSWGGTPAQAWTSLEGLAAEPELKEYVEAAKHRLATYDADVASYKTRIAEFQAAKKQWDETTGKAYQEDLKAWNLAAAEAKKAGTPAPPKPEPATPMPNPPADPNGGSRDATSLYNGMIAPIIPYAIKGAIWYQGESNAGKSKEYRTLFPAMVADWRSRWNLGSFPFLFVQIAPFKGQPPEIREAQFLSLGRIPNSAMAVTTDVGDANDIHPSKKEPVGQRLALAARAVAYGEAITFSGPLYDAMTVKDGKAILKFRHTGGGLIAKDGPLKGFMVAGKDKNFVPAKAEIIGKTVAVSAEGVAHPVAVRYGWENVPDVNLFNKEGLPASPFRTDVD